MAEEGDGNKSYSLLDRVGLLTGILEPVDEGGVEEPVIHSGEFDSNTSFTSATNPTGVLKEMPVLDTSEVLPDQELLKQMLHAVYSGKDGKVSRLVSSMDKLSKRIPDKKDLVVAALEVLDFSAQEILSSLTAVQEHALQEQVMKFEQSKDIYLTKHVKERQRELDQLNAEILGLEAQIDSVKKKLEVLRPKGQTFEAEINQSKVQAAEQEQKFQATLIAARENIGALIKQLSQLTGGTTHG